MALLLLSLFCLTIQTAEAGPCPDKPPVAIRLHQPEPHGAALLTAKVHEMNLLVMRISTLGMLYVWSRL
jgi:hypothetical protein